MAAKQTPVFGVSNPSCLLCSTDFRFVAVVWTPPSTSKYFAVNLVTRQFSFRQSTNRTCSLWVVCNTMTHNYTLGGSDCCCWSLGARNEKSNLFKASERPEMPHQVPRTYADAPRLGICAKFQALYGLRDLLLEGLFVSAFFVRPFFFVWRPFVLAQERKKKRKKRHVRGEKAGP